MELTNFLSKTTIFTLLSDQDRARIADRLQRHCMAAGQAIIVEGETDKRLFIIEDGVVDVIKDMGTSKERPLASLGPGDYFGEMALVDNLERSASVVARYPTRLLSLDQQDLLAEIAKNPSIALELLATLSRRVRTLEKAMVGSLGHLLPICAYCKKIRISNGRWIAFEAYIADRSNTRFNHGICPECKENHLSLLSVDKR